MADVEVMQKEIENKLFDFIEENFGKKRYECFNEVVNFVQNELISNLNEYDELEDLKIDNEELESRVEECVDAFDCLKENCIDILNELVSELNNLNDVNMSSLLKYKISKIKEWVYKESRKIEDSDIC